MTTPVRKVLTIKSKPYGMMWQAPSKLQEIESILKQSIDRILEEYTKTPVNNYVEEYRRSSTAVKDLTNCLKESYQELQSSIKYPNQSKQLFEKMIEGVLSYLTEQNKETTKFLEALNNFQHPKELLPKVSLPSIMPGR